jgi:hypothetical protein
VALLAVAQFIASAQALVRALGGGLLRVAGEQHPAQRQRRQQGEQAAASAAGGA